MSNIEVSSMILNKKTAVISVSGQIDDHFITKLMLEFGNYGRESSIEDITIIMNSGGGQLGLITSFYEIFAPMGLKRIIGCGVLCSSALALALDVCRKGLDFYIDPSCYVLLHRCFCETSESRPDMIKEFVSGHLEFVDDLFTGINQPLIGKLNKKKIEIYRNGGNVYLTGKQLIDFGLAQEFTGLEQFIVPIRKAKNIK